MTMQVVDAPVPGVRPVVANAADSVLARMRNDTVAN